MEKLFLSLKKLRPRNKKPLEKSNTATPFCRVCFKEITSLTYASIVSGLVLCSQCFEELKPRLEVFEIEGVKAMSLYPYNESFRSRLFLFKGQGDIELSSTFLSYQLPFLKLRFHGFHLVGAPSHISHDERRGFNQVTESFKFLGLPQLDLLIKTEDVKQANRTKEERQLVKNSLALKEQIDLKDKKILFADDVFTTGATARACLDLLKSLHPKKLEALFLAKTPFKEKSD